MDEDPPSDEVEWGAEANGLTTDDHRAWREIRGSALDLLLLSRVCHARSSCLLPPAGCKRNNRGNEAFGSTLN